MADLTSLPILRKALYEISCHFHEVSDQDLLSMLYKRDDLFKNLILWTMSKIDDELGKYLWKSQNLTKDLIGTLIDLQFTKKEDKDKFVSGKLSEGQQFKVWMLILKTVKQIMKHKGKSEKDMFNIDDLVFKEPQKRDLSFYDLSGEANKTPSSEELDLLLQDAIDKVQLLESLTVEQTTTEIPFTIYQSSNDIETLLTSITKEIEDFKEAVADDANRFCSIKPDGVPLIEEEKASKIKQLVDTLSSASSILSLLNGCKNDNK